MTPQIKNIAVVGSRQAFDKWKRENAKEGERYIHVWQYQKAEGIKFDGLLRLQGWLDVKGISRIFETIQRNIIKYNKKGVEK